MVLGTFVRRFVDGAVLAFAAYAFVFVPLGKHTAWEHVRALLASRESAAAGQEIKQAGEKLIRELVTSQNTQPREVPGEPVLPEIAPAQMRVAPQAQLLDPTAVTDEAVCSDSDPNL